MQAFWMPLPLRDHQWVGGGVTKSAGQTELCGLPARTRFHMHQHSHGQNRRQHKHKFKQTKLLNLMVLSMLMIKFTIVIILSLPFHLPRCRRGIIKRSRPRQQLYNTHTHTHIIQSQTLANAPFKHNICAHTQTQICIHTHKHRGKI